MAEKWKPEIKSPGDAWMDHVEKQHGASAATPGYLKPEEKGAGVKAIETKMAELQKRMDKQEPGKEPEVTKHQEKLKEKKPDKNISPSK